MRHSIGLAWVAGFLFASAAPLSAQTTIERARDVLADRKPAPVAPTRVEPVRVEPGRTTTIIVPQREVVVIERVQSRPGWWNQPKYRVITVYYDGARFYRRPFDRRPLRKVVVYQSAGHYYIDDVQWRRDHRRYYGRDYDWKDGDRRRHDDRWDDNRGRNEDKWNDNDRRNDNNGRQNDDNDRRNDDDDKDGSKGNNGRHLGRGHDKDKDKD
jgi:hypothetical protein